MYSLIETCSILSDFPNRGISFVYSSRVPPASRTDLIQAYSVISVLLEHVPSKNPT